MLKPKNRLRLSPFNIAFTLAVTISPGVFLPFLLRAQASSPAVAIAYQPASLTSSSPAHLAQLTPLSTPTVVEPSPGAEPAPSLANPNATPVSAPDATSAQPPAPETPPSPPDNQSPTAPPNPASDSPALTPEASPGVAPGSAQPSFSGTEVAPTPTDKPTPEAEPKVLISELAIAGASPELETLIYNLLQTKPGRTATRSQLQEDVNAIYASGYFSDVKVSPQDTPLGVKVTFTVVQNPLLQSVIIETVPLKERNPALPPEIVQTTFGDQYGKILNLRDLQNGIKQINDWYAKNGYDLAQIVGAPKVGSDGVVTLVIAEGIVQDIKVRFFDAEEAPVQGKTRDFIVTREMRLKPGDVFNRNQVQSDLRRVFGLGLFEDVRLSFTPGDDPREVIVNVDVVEGNTGSIAAGAGVSSNSGIFGTLSYQEKNLGGNNQTVGGEVQVGQRELLFDVNFSDPWIAGDPFRTSYTVNGFRRQTTSLVFDTDQASIRTLNCDGVDNIFCNDNPRVVRTGLGVNFVRPIAKDVFTKPDWLLSAGFTFQHVQITNSNGNISPLSAPLNGFPSQFLAFSPSGTDDLFTFSLGASQDWRNNPLQPTSGSLFRVGIEQSAPLGSGAILFNRIRGSYSYYIPLDFIDFGFIDEKDPKPQTLAFNFQAGTVLGDLPPYEAFVVGGSNSVRGYAEGEVGSGRSFFQATAEYRFPIISAVGGALFVDFGTLLSSDGAVPGTPSRILGLPGNGTGYGLGVRIQSPVGPIRVDYGFKATGGSRLSFGIGERF